MSAIAWSPSRPAHRKGNAGPRNSTHRPAKATVEAHGRRSLLEGSRRTISLDAAIPLFLQGPHTQPRFAVWCVDGYVSALGILCRVAVISKHQVQQFTDRPQPAHDLTMRVLLGQELRRHQA